MKLNERELEWWRGLVDHYIASNATAQTAVDVANRILVAYVNMRDSGIKPADESN
jgi:hypothetical protein